VAALAFIRRVRPSTLEQGQPAGRGGWVAGGLAVALILVLLAPFASGHPDGLEWVAESAGFLGAANGAPYGILPDYTVPLLGNSGLSTIAAGVAGVLVVAGLVILVSRVLRGDTRTEQLPR
jgi:cobalt/nickel transport system permease protein